MITLLDISNRFIPDPETRRTGRETLHRESKWLPEAIRLWPTCCITMSLPLNSAWNLISFSSIINLKCIILKQYFLKQVMSQTCTQLRIPGSILSLGYCLDRVLHVLWVSSGVFPPSNKTVCRFK